MNKQNGFAHAFLIIGLVVALIGALGFVFWQNFIYKEPVSTKVEIITKADSKESSPATAPANDGYLVIKEWGVKLKTSSAQHLVYQPYSRVGGTENTAYDALGLKIKSKSVVEQGCVNFGTDLLRQKVPTEFDSIKIGEYFYYVTGAPGQCSEHDSDLKLQEAILNDLRVENIESI